MDITGFLGNARWFGGKGRPFRVTAVHRIGRVPHIAPGGPRVVVDVVAVQYDDTEGGTQLYQLPLACYAEPQDRLGHALVGIVEDDDDLVIEEGGTCYLYDAVHDRDAMAGYLESFAVAESGGPLVFHRVSGHELDLTTHSTLMSAEQSNSSVAFGEDALLKVFRRLTPGVNPDIAIHEVLTRAESDRVAALYGWVEAASPTEPEGPPLQLAMLQQFLRTASDGWELALASVRNLFVEADLHADEVGGDFAAESSRLGEAVASVHHDLAVHFDTGTADLATVSDQMSARLDAALSAVPELAEYESELRAVFARLAALGKAPVQRVHGDLHLGQTLRTVKGWKIVDFEGEPAKPLAERSQPDSVWRDVAGMLRSFDYAPRAVEMTLGADDRDEAAQRSFRAGEWAERNCRAFLDSYAGRELTEEEETLMSAYLVDKAVYETVYETRNRPGWLAIPLAAIARLAG